MVGVPTPSATVPEGSAFGLSNSTSSSIRFSPDVLKTFLRKIYGKEFDTSKEIEPTAWREVLRIMNEATVEGLSQSDYQIQPSHSELFLKELRHGNEIFSAFKVHTMAEQMAAKLYDDKGNLKSFERWLSDVESISSHHVGSWLRTEYDTAVIRAHQAADWQQFLQNQDIMPNLRWMPTTSAEPESSHAVYWRSKLTLPISDPFWNDHHPGDRWNCKCSLEQTDEPVVPLSSAEGELPKPQRGLENNPGKDGKLFSQNHPYFPDSCSKCSVRGAQGFTNLQILFTNRQKDCFNCPFINGCIDRATEKRTIEQAANAAKQRVKDNDLMVLDNDKSLQNLYSGVLHKSGKSRTRFLKHAHHDYDVEAAIHAWNNPSVLNRAGRSALGEGKDMTLPENIQNVQKKLDRGVIEYLKYEFEYGGRTFVVKTELLRYGKEQFYSVIEK